MPPCLDDDRSTKKVRIREGPDRLAPEGEEVSEQNLDENMEEASDIELTKSKDGDRVEYEQQRTGLYGCWE